LASSIEEFLFNWSVTSEGGAALTFKFAVPPLRESARGAGGTSTEQDSKKASTIRLQDAWPHGSVYHDEVATNRGVEKDYTKVFGEGLCFTCR